MINFTEIDLIHDNGGNTTNIFLLGYGFYGSLETCSLDFILHSFFFISLSFDLHNKNKNQIPNLTLVRDSCVLFFTTNKKIGG